MDKSGVEEEFAPLFDYSGVHSAGFHCLSDDDLDDSPVVSNGSRKRKDCKASELSTKEELASLAEAAKDLLNSASEFGNSDVCILENSAEDTKEDKCFAKVEREKIVISILDDKGGQQQFRLFVDDKFERLFKTYAEKVKVKPESLVFSFDGERVSPTATPAGLGLEKDDIIEVNVLSSFDQCECVDR
ncbi:hypothetical protein KFK09_004699 [Dendrobium nobile]|uniref:Rad60/SUMO-like domain-containing protein n=1 Tax=Dendrobium nobile TaxID=94219 RepID=A0A8T3BW39_DENNO|nr:hypothetical protein KFK09_004699 [Dendrobium nobile]